MTCLFSLVGTLILLGAIFVTAADFPIVQGVSLVKKTTAAYSNHNDGPIQLTGKVSISALNNNNTPLTNATYSSPQEIHKPSSPKSPEEIQTEKEQIQKSKPNITVFTQQMPHHP